MFLFLFFYFIWTGQVLLHLKYTYTYFFFFFFLDLTFFFFVDPKRGFWGVNNGNYKITPILYVRGKVVEDFWNVCLKIFSICSFTLIRWQSHWFLFMDQQLCYKIIIKTKSFHWINGISIIKILNRYFQFWKIKKCIAETN